MKEVETLQEVEKITEDLKNEEARVKNLQQNLETVKKVHQEFLIRSEEKEIEWNRKLEEKEKEKKDIEEHRELDRQEVRREKREKEKLEGELKKIKDKTSPEFEAKKKQITEIEGKDHNSFFFENSTSIRKFHMHVAHLLAHPLQRPDQATFKTILVND